jgi:hypothetical protein
MLITLEDPVVRQRHFARQRHLAAPDQAHIGDGVVRGATWARGDNRRAVPGEAGDAMDTGSSIASARVITGKMVVR